MQFLAAKSRWMRFFEARYFIPSAICEHIPISLVLIRVTCIHEGELDHIQEIQMVNV